jgi:hypothetical protein
MGGTALLLECLMNPPRRDLVQRQRKVDLDVAENMNALSELGTETAQKFDDQLDKFVKLLVLQN